MTKDINTVFGHLYELSANLSECLYLGRIAGKEAAKEAS